MLELGGIILFLFGLAIGSFLNVLIDRLAQDQSILSPPSHCDRCKRPLAWYDLIPVVSFTLLRGRCRYCHSPIGWQYPIVELVSGILFVSTYFFLSSARILNHESGIMNILSLGYYLFIVASLTTIFFTDLKYGIIPDKIVFPAIVVSIIYFLILHTSYFLLLNHLLTGALSFLFFFAIYALTRGRGMGFGDVKLALLLGFIFGFPKVILVFYAAFLTGAAFSIILILLRRKRLKETIAFGPFLIVAAFLVLFFGESLQLFVWSLLK